MRSDLLNLVKFSFATTQELAVHRPDYLASLKRANRSPTFGDLEKAVQIDEAAKRA